MKARPLTKQDHEMIPAIMETMRPNEWLESQPRFSEEYMKVALMAREIFFEMEEKGN